MRRGITMDILDTHAGLAGQALVDAVALTLQKPHSYAAKVAAVIEAQAKKRAQRARNRELSALAARIPVSQLARDYGLTRQTVSRVVNHAKKRPLG